jgi:hypothetical protein
VQVLKQQVLDLVVMHLRPENTVATEEYDGSTWGPGGNMGTARRGFAGAGIQTAAVGFGGNLGPAITAATEEYDGSLLGLQEEI